MEAATITCFNHPANAAAHTCAQCHRAICNVCEFETASGSLCPECMSAGPSPEQKSASLAKAVWSVVLAVAGMVVLVGITMVAGASSTVSKSDEMLYGLVYILALGAGLGGLALGLVSREYSRAAGSPLPMIGIVANGILVGLILFLSLVGVFSGS